MQREVKLDGKQKKWLKKHRRSADEKTIAKHLGLSIEDARKLLGKKEEIISVQKNEYYWLMVVLATETKSG